MSSATAKTPTAATAPAQKKGRKSASLPPETVEYLKAWMMSPEHVAHPYPTDHEKAEIMADTGIELKQLTNWFVNNRKRFWKPRVEAKLQGKGQPHVHAPSPAAGVGSGTGMGRPAPSDRGGPKVSITVPQINSPVLQNKAIHARGSSGVVGATSRHNQPISLGPAVAVSSVNGPLRREDDLHTISDGSGSSACNSDDESIAASSTTWVRAAPAFGPASVQYADTHLATVGGVSTAGTTGPPATTPSGGGYRRREEVDVHVLRPECSFDGSNSQPLPTLRDLTIKSCVPKERILATFKCPITFTVQYDIEHDSKKVQNRRDGEVLRVKKHYLNLYLATRGIHSTNTPIGIGDAPSSSSSSTTFSSTGASTVHTVPPLNTSAAVSAPSSRSRSFARAELKQEKDKTSNPSLRKRARADFAGPLSKGEEEWRCLCQYAKGVYCESLPDLDEAAMMFGYASQ